MDRDSLVAWLEQGLSLAEIGKRVRRDPSTVRYWMRKHELAPVHASRHLPVGGVDRRHLEGLVEGGATYRQMAQELGVSLGTVRYWMARYGLRTKAREIRTERGRARAAGQRLLRAHCPTHGHAEFVLEGRGYYRCRECRQERVVEWRRRAKRRLIDEAGGRCLACGYDRYPGALHFHHRDPDEKRFSLATRGLSRSIEQLRIEAAKCVLLCANCHAEVEAGIRVTPVD